MKVQTATRAIQLQEWATQINARIESGQTIKAWCEEYGLSSKTYYYRLKRIREELLETAEAANMPAVPGKPVFAALPAFRSSGSAITIRMGSCSVEIQNGADSVTIENVLQIISRL